MQDHKVTRQAAVFVCAAIVAAGAGKSAGSPPPGRPHRLTIEGENIVTFMPEVGLNPVKINYRARVEYLIDTRLGDDFKPRSEPASAAKQAARKPTSAARKAKSSVNERHEEIDARVAGAVDLALHSTEMRLRQNGKSMLDTRLTRSKFQGRVQPGTPALTLNANEAPPRLQAIMKTYDSKCASLLVDDNARLVDRRFRSDGPQGALVETLLSIHTPIPRDFGAWEAPTQLAMGQGQTAKGTLRFEKRKDSLSKTGGFVQVKVAGVLKAEGAVVGRFIKDGTYTVTGEQTYDPRSREWTAARWSVDVETDLADADGVLVAHAQGKMIVDSHSVDAAGTSASSSSFATSPIEAKPTAADGKR